MTKITEEYLTQRGFYKTNIAQKNGSTQYKLLIGEKIEILYFFKGTDGVTNCLIRFIESEKLSGYVNPIDTEEQMEKVIEEVEQIIKQ